MPFRSIAGHRLIVDLLSRSAARGSMPPSLIFAGPEGVGKRTVAVASAQALNCLAPISTGSGRSAAVDACGECAACTRIARGVHPDVLVLEPGDTGSIKIDAVRDVIDRAAYRPFEGRRRFVIVDDADALVEQAQNALLKTLEEPPSSSMFILVTARPDTLLPTVQSRCVRLRFGSLGAGDIADVLMARGVAADEAHALAATSAGSVGRALETSGSGEVAKSRDVARRLLVDVSKGDARGRLEAAKATVAKGTGTIDRLEFGSYLSVMASLLRDIQLLNARADTKEIANADLRTDLERLASSFGGQRAVRAFAAVDRARNALDGNAGVKIVADWLVLQI